MILQRGFRDKIEKYADPNREIVVEMRVDGNSVYDYCCFGVDGNGKLSDDRYMVFYNQTTSPGNEITYSPDGNGARYVINLSKLPQSINKLVFTVSIDGNGTMGSIMSHTVSLKQDQNSFADLNLSGSDFHSEKAIIAIEIYKKDVWRIAVVASGFNGGLGDLLRAYGGEEASSSTPAPQPASSPQPVQQPVQQPSFNQPQQPSFNQPQQPGPMQSPQQPGFNQPQQPTGPMQSPQQPGFNQPQQPTGPMQSPQQPSFGQPGGVPKPQAPAGPQQPSFGQPQQPSGPMQSPQQPGFNQPQQPTGPMQSPQQPGFNQPQQPTGPMQSPQQPTYNPNNQQKAYNPYGSGQPTGPMQSPQQPGFNQPQQPSGPMQSPQQPTGPMQSPKQPANAPVQGYNPPPMYNLQQGFHPEAYQNNQQNNAMEAPQKKEKISLKKGEKVSLSKNNSGAPIIVENGWTAKGKDYDLKALVRYRDGRLIYVGAANLDEVLCTPEGAVCHGGDIKNPGELEHIEIKWHPDIASVAVSSYSAIENGTGSFYKYGVYVRIRNGRQTVEIPAASTSANDMSYTLCFGEILFGTEKDSFEISALELYSKPGSENRVGYQNGQVCMDIGPTGKTKNQNK